MTPQCPPCLWLCLGVASEEMKSVQCKNNLKEELSCGSWILGAPSQPPGQGERDGAHDAMASRTALPEHDVAA